MTSPSSTPGNGAEASSGKEPAPPGQGRLSTAATVGAGPGGTDTRPANNTLHVPQALAARAASEAEGDYFEDALPILPRGIVENTAEVYSEVASFAVVPPEKLQEYWRVYTVTHRKLYDPTANRLENFWWHVWGSKSRGLSGKTIARLYKDISLGPTFVPLRTPTNRYEGPTISTHVRLPESVASEPAPRLVEGLRGSAQQPPKTERAAPSTAHSNATTTEDSAEYNVGTLDDAADAEGGEETEEDVQVKLLSSSSSRPAPAQSILRKPRPSLSGPRPTPRFALPSGEPSEAEEGGAENNEEASPRPSTRDDAAARRAGSRSGSDSEDSSATPPSSHQQASSGLPNQPSSTTSGSKKAAAGKRDARKPSKPKVAKKKFVVSSAAPKRRALASKRSGSHGSQSSAGSGSTVFRRGPSSNYSEDSLIEEDEPEGAGAQGPPSNDAKVPSKHTKQKQGGDQALPSPAMKGTPPADDARAALSQQQQSHRPASSAVSSSGPPVLEMPTAPRRQLPGPGPRQGLLVRHSTMPYEVGPRHRQLISRGAESIVTPAAAHSGRLPAPTSAYSGPGNAGAAAAGDAFGASAPVTAAIGMGRSMSQESYSSRPQSVRDGYQSPILGPKRPATVAAPSMVAVSGVFMDADGPDPLELYARTGLDESLLDERPDLAQAPFEGGSLSSSFQDGQATQRPLFTPTRPTQTPRIPFARTRSQLNVILDRERERLGEGSFASWRESRSGRDQESQREREHGSRG